MHRVVIERTASNEALPHFVRWWQMAPIRPIRQARMRFESFHQGRTDFIPCHFPSHPALASSFSTRGPDDALVYLDNAEATVHAGQQYVALSRCGRVELGPPNPACGGDDPERGFEGASVK